MDKCKGFWQFREFLQIWSLKLKNNNNNRLFLDKLPISIRYLLEAAVRHCDEFHVLGKDVETILDWEKTQHEQKEIPFKPGRVILQVI